MKAQMVGGWMDGWMGRWMNRGHSCASSRCSIHISALCVFAFKRDRGCSPSSQLSALRRGCELTSAWVALQQPRVSVRCWGPAGACAHHESPAGSPWPSRPAPSSQPSPASSPTLQDSPGCSQGNAGPARGIHPAGCRAHWHRTGSRGPAGMKTPGGSLAGRGHPGWQQGCPCRRLPVLSQPGHQRRRAPSRTTSAPLAHHRGFRMSWHPQF